MSSPITAFKIRSSTSGKRDDGVNAPEIAWAALKIALLDARPRMKQLTMLTVALHLARLTKPSAMSSDVLSGFSEITAR